MFSTEQSRWFVEEVKPHERILRGYLQKRFPSLSDHDDIVQEAYIRLLRAESNGRLTCAKAFLFTVARNVAIDLLRRRQAAGHDRMSDVAETRVLDEATSVAESLERQQRQEVLIEAIASLPDRCREVLMLRHLDGLSYKEIATRLGISPNTVKSAHGEGRSRLHRFFPGARTFGYNTGVRPGRGFRGDDTMNPSDQMHDDSVFDEAAAEWLCERDEGLVPERAKAFAEWCQRDPRHVQAVARVERTLALLDEMPAVRAPLEARVAGAGTPPAQRVTGRIFRFPRMAWAAGLAAALAIGIFMWREVSFRAPAGEHYATDTAAQRSLALPDGSVMDINVGSDVSVQFNARERRVTLSKGEAHFEVAHDTARPFIVTAGGVTVRAVGTAFNVRLATEAVDVVVVEGRVELGRGAASLTTTGPVVAPPLLSAGERAQMSRDDRMAEPKIEKLDERSIHAMLIWQNPMTSFTDVTLRDVVARFNRRNVTQLVLQDADLGERRIGGMIALDQVDAFVRLLAQDGDIVVERQAAGQIGLRRAR